mgnify:CR=1 FL=1|jgi:hypothetical protein
METVKLNINLNQLMDAVKQLSPKDRMKVNDAIWRDDMEIPIEHQKKVLDRVVKSKKNPERLLEWDIVSKSL